MNRTAALLNFLNSSPSPHHVVEVSKQALLKAGFIQLFEGEGWNDQIRPAGKYFITRNGTSIVAMTVERDYVN
jgi:aspartyl aminopeptidase